MFAKTSTSQLLWCLLPLGFCVPASWASAQTDSAVTPPVSVCDISANEAAYEGRRVRVRAHFTAWWEGGVLKDAACPNVLYALSLASDPKDPIYRDAQTQAFNDDIDAHMFRDLVTYDLVFDARFSTTGQPALAKDGVLTVEKVISFRKLDGQP